MKVSVKQTGRQFFGLVLPVLLFVMLLAGCHAAPGEEKAEDMRTPTDDNLIVVGVSQVGSESVWRTANTASIRKAFTKENGYFLIFDNARQKQENQIKALRSFISQRVDYIVFSPITEDGWDTVLQEAKEAGIPVILIDRKVNVKDQSLYTTWIGSDFQQEGQMAGETLAGYLKARGRQEEDIRMVVLQGTKGATATIGRSAGFDQVAKLHPNWLILEQVDAEFTTAKGQEEMKRLLARYEDIDVVISQNDDMTFGALDAIHQAGKTVGEDGDILVISFDAVEDALKLVEDGIITADIECNPNQGEYAEAIIRQLESGEPVDKMNFLPERVFTRENIQEFRSGSDD
ncbi:MAG: ABC transporter substrate-binding protein [Hungatella hathewayi]|nr:ABC transporter substrate-binding protein [Hungatella hathewayi]